MILAHVFNRFITWFIYMGMPAVAFYHHVHENIFLSVSADDATGLERVGNFLLTPVQYLIDGRVAERQEEGEVYSYVLKSQYNYTDYLSFRLASSVVLLPMSALSGTLVKGLAYLTPGTRRRHKQIAESIASTEIISHLEEYKKMGIDLSHFKKAERIAPPSYKRRPGEENNLKPEKEALAEIAKIFKENNIPFWVDCGTCLGAYRYGGAIPWDDDIDIAVLAPDFENVGHALQALDKSKYHLQDWSARDKPQTYYWVYIKETHGRIDIYHFDLNSEKKMATSIVSNENSAYLPNSWKVRESRYAVPTPFDVIFPLKEASFDGIAVYVPNKTKEYLQMRFGENIDPVKLYNETTQTYEKDLNHPYWQRPYVY